MVTHPQPPSNYLDMCDPEALVTRIGRWSYEIYVIHGAMAIGPNGYPWHRFGRARAERKARRELARYKRERARHKVTWRIS